MADQGYRWIRRMLENGRVTKMPDIGFIRTMIEKRKKMLLLLAITLFCGLLFVYQYSGEIYMSLNVITIKCKGKVLRVPTVFTYGEMGWKRNKTICEQCFNFPKIQLKTDLGSTPMFIYNIRDDDWVSMNLQKHGVFDEAKLSVIHTFLKIDPDLNFIDIGANIGKVIFDIWLL